MVDSTTPTPSNVVHTSALEAYPDRPEQDSPTRDSAIGSTSSYATSLLSEVKNYKYENGRRYHSYREGQYVLPNDEQEQDREDLLHHVRSLIFDGELTHAPIKDGISNILDIGTGTGMKNQ
jgi:hypothetical protein